MDKNDLDLFKLHKYCLILIFSFVNIGDVVNLMLTSKRIRDLIENNKELIWEKYTMRDFGNHYFLDRSLFSDWKETYLNHFKICHTCDRNFSEIPSNRNRCEKCNKLKYGILIMNKILK